MRLTILKTKFKCGQIYAIHLILNCHIFLGNSIKRYSIRIFWIKQKASSFILNVTSVKTRET